MSTTFRAPGIDNRVVCIVDREQGDLAAIIASYFHEDGWYCPFFEFPDVAALDTETDDFQSDNYVSLIVGREAAIVINNALARMGSCEYIILAGLSQHQRSYLKIPAKIKRIEIDNIQKVHECLSPLDMAAKPELRCTRADLLKGLFVAKREGSHLVLDDTAKPLADVPLKQDEGIIVTENYGHTNSVIAANYAAAIGANFLVVGPLSDGEEGEIQREIQDWKEQGITASYDAIRDRVLQRVGQVPFDNLAYATFFTKGLPYSLIIKNIIPCTYVHLSLRPDLFVLNNILFEYGPKFRSAVVFSPLFFPDEETKHVIDFFKSSNHYVRSLLGRTATVRSLDFHVQHFPYDLLHICSHGGEVDGYYVSETFTDRKGQQHIIEYDEVVGFSPVPGKDRIAVHRKTIFRKLDGWDWMSEELRQQNYPQYIVEDMRKAMYQRDDQEGVVRKTKSKIPTSCAIACSDSIHQGMFQRLASHSSPVIFNNTCWSWYEVAKFFLSGGARTYIGTLWDIGNQPAVDGAKHFYDHLFGSTILGAFQKAAAAIKGTSSEDIYVFWGLHFSTLSKGTKVDEGRTNVLQELMRALYTWIEKVQTTRSKEVRANSLEIVRDLDNELKSNFDKHGFEELEKILIIEGTVVLNKMSQDQPSLEHPDEFKNPKPTR